jgi:ribosomal-protein-alanine N-acetyltransferase
MIELRPGTVEDESRLREIVAEAPEAARFVDGPAVLVAELEGRVAGFVLYRIVVGEGEILNLAVAAEARRRGVGRALLKAVLPLAELWHLEMRESNAAARALYAGCGFDEVGRRKGYYADGETAVLLTFQQSS